MPAFIDYNQLVTSSGLTDQVIIVNSQESAEDLSATLPLSVLICPAEYDDMSKQDWSLFSGKKVVIWPDNDSYSLAIAYALSGAIRRDSGDDCHIMLIDVPFTAPEGWNFSVWSKEKPKLDEIVNFISSNLIDPHYINNSSDVPVPSEENYHVPDEYLSRPDDGRDSATRSSDTDQPSDTEQSSHQTAQAPPDYDSLKQYFPFHLLGYDRGTYYYLSKQTKQVIELRPESHQCKNLLQLAPLSWWQRVFPGKSQPVNWDGAADYLINNSTKTGVFDPARIRGRGAWEDSGRSVLHAGGHLVVDGLKIAINDFDTKYIYEVSRDLDQQISGHPLSSRESNEFATLCEYLSWTKSINAALLAGWCVVAPICGAIRWRPHVWLTGSKGTGKSWILENIVKPTVGGSALGVVSSTTEAGIRQTLVNDARPVVFDEAEGEKKEDQKRIQGILELARQASSESASAIFKGTSGGRSMAFHIRSCFLFASIGINITHDSDASRVTVLSLIPRNDPEGFKALRDRTLSLLTPEYCARLRARSVALIPRIRKNAEIFATAGAEYLGSQRAGDQIGSLLAGYYALKRSDEVSIDRAREFIAEQSKAGGWDDVSMLDDESDEWRCLYTILGHVIKIQKSSGPKDVTIGELINTALGYAESTDDVRAAEKVLRMNGIRTGSAEMKKEFVISNTSDKVKNMLIKTAWSNGWKNLLMRLPTAERSESMTFSPGVKSRGTVLNEVVLGEVG